MNITFRDQKSGKQGSITLDGNLTVNRAEELRMLLIKVLVGADRVHVDFGSVTDVDLSCLQLLCSAHRSASRMKRRLSLSGDWPEPFRQAVEDAGYMRLAGCHLDTDHSCLWIRQ
jgi:anti-anti-sigma regulatory factor